MKCQHTWIKANRAYEDYQCSQCEMGLSVDEYDAIQQAHRHGWEQCKAEVEKVMANTRRDEMEYGDIGKAEKAIAAMEYKEKANELP